MSQPRTITSADIEGFASELENLQYEIDAGQPAPCEDCCGNLAEAKLSHGHCECECADVEEHCAKERESERYWSWYFGLTTADGTPTGRTILQSGFTVAIEDGDAPGGWRHEMVGTVGR